MKDQKNDSTPVLARFGRDKRVRTVKATAERVERRPRSQRDAADSEQPYREQPAGRASYNPHFTADNRPAFDRPRDGRPHRDSGERPRRAFDDDRARSGEERPRRAFGAKPHAFGERSRQDGEHPHRSFGDKPRTPGGKPAFGAKRFGGKPGDRTFGDRPHGEHPSGDRFRGKSGDRKSGGRPAGDRRPGFGKPAARREGAPASYPKYDPAKQTGEMRLNRFLAQSGICSRREADDFITAGLVSVNGKIVTELGTKVMPTDEVRFNDSRVQGEKKVYLVLNKPKGYVTSLDDPHAAKTVMDLVRGACTERIYPVGRLDKNSLGLLLFTNDGDMTKQLTHPSYRKKKIYQVSLDKPLTRADMDRIAEGVTLEDGEIHADEISYVKENKQEVGIEIHSGRNRIVRRIFESLGYTVTKLDRVYYAGLTKKNLKRGAWRFLTREEVERLKSGQYE
ncbi:pseudouridine synthase [Alistipes dispar]|uniref:pseudouridine synthase n=1 Tax=Alistipes dispar TaxID=2585119 RepID=UPI003A90778E